MDKTVHVSVDAILRNKGINHGLLDEGVVLDETSGREAAITPTVVISSSLTA